jgi:hypothetical protein
MTFVSAFRCSCRKLCKQIRESRRNFLATELRGDATEAAFVTNLQQEKLCSTTDEIFRVFVATSLFDLKETCFIEASRGANAHVAQKRLCLHQGRVPDGNPAASFLH